MNKKINKIKKDHEKFLEKMGVSKKQLKGRKKIKEISIFNTNYGERYYDDKPNGGISYTPKSRDIVSECENKTTMEEIARKNNIGMAMIDAQYGTPRDLGYAEKVLPKSMNLTK